MTIDELRARGQAALPCPTCGHERVTLRELGAVAGVQPSSMHRFLAGGGGIRFRTAERLAHWLRATTHA